MTNKECKVRPEIVNVSSHEPLFHPFSTKASKCSGSCNNINYPYAKICTPDAVKDWNLKVLNLMSRTNEARHIKWHELFKCKCRLDPSVCNDKQRWNDDKCRCECKELIDKGVCDKGYTWNHSNCECECDKSCDAGEYLDYENCKCRKRLVGKLVEEFNENIDEAKLTEIALLEHKNKCVCYYTVFIVLTVIALTVSTGIGVYFVYYKYMNRIKENVSLNNFVYQAKKYD